MRFALVVLLAVTVVSAVPWRKEKMSEKFGDKMFLQRQKDVLRLFKYINQPSFYKDHYEVSKTYSIEKNVDSYTNPQVVKQFLKYFKQGMLPKGEIFSVFNEEQLKQAITLFKIFYYAKDYDTFYKTAVWARAYVNEGMFMYAVSVAIVHRDDCYGIVLPPIYEVYPYYFYNNEVIEKAQRYKQEFTGVQSYPTGTYKGFTIEANYSGWYLNLNPEQSMSYFTEDIGMNAYYYYFNLYYPFWLGGEEFKLKNDRRGEQFYFVYQQLLARMYMERLSNGFGEIPVFDWERPFETGFYPSLRYPNGLEFSVRPCYVTFFKDYFNYGQSYAFRSKYPYSMTFVRDYERRIRDAIDKGYVYTVDGKKVDLFESFGFDTLGKMIESNPDSPNSRFYGPWQIFARHLLGYSYQPLSPYKLAPSALEHFETSLRDPAFWQMYKRMILYFQMYKTYLPKYTYNELNFESIKIQGMKVDDLITYFEKYDVDITQSVYVTPQEFDSDVFQVRARQQRLNHKPFTYKVNVESTKEVEGVVRVFMGPKYDEYGRPINMSENRMNFVEFDKFVYKFKKGSNVVERNSIDCEFVADRTSFKDLYKKVDAAIKGEQKFKVEQSEAYYGFPYRFLLPKGKVGGQKFQFYVIVSEYKAPTQKVQYEQFYYPKVGTGMQYIDTYPLGYPFDRPIDEYSFYVPNSWFQEVTVYHKQWEELNTSTPRF